MENRVIGVKILIVDDDRSVLQYMDRILAHAGYEIKKADNARDAMAILENEQIDVLLTDIHMPGESGLWLLEQARKLALDASIIVITASHKVEDAVATFNIGAENYMLKPLQMDEVLHKVRIAVEKRKLFLDNLDYQYNLATLVERRTKELTKAKDAIKKSYIETIQRLAVAAEYKDHETGGHLRRIGLYTKVISEYLALPVSEAEKLQVVGAMHDLGKISIPDEILLKPGALTGEEFEIMKNHTVIGAKILQDSDSAFLRVAEQIALCHHEKWDGSGYPNGLKGKEIPVESRILAIVDQYDAIRSRRPYKPAVEHQRAFSIITEGDEKSYPGQFDPAVLGAFVKCHEEFDRIFESEN